MKMVRIEHLSDLPQDGVVEARPGIPHRAQIVTERGRSRPPGNRQGGQAGRPSRRQREVPARAGVQTSKQTSERPQPRPPTGQPSQMRKQKSERRQRGPPPRHAPRTSGTRARLRVGAARGEPPPLAQAARGAPPPPARYRWYDLHAVRRAAVGADARQRKCHPAPEPPHRLAERRQMKKRRKPVAVLEARPRPQKSPPPTPNRDQSWSAAAGWRRATLPRP